MLYWNKGGHEPGLLSEQSAECWCSAEGSCGPFYPAAMTSHFPKWLANINLNA